MQNTSGSFFAGMCEISYSKSCIIFYCHSIQTHDSDDAIKYVEDLVIAGQKWLLVQSILTDAQIKNYLMSS